MAEVILTALVCYAAVGIYILLVFDHADAEKGWDLPDFWGQVQVVLQWPHFIYMMAHEDSYIVEVGDE